MRARDAHLRSAAVLTTVAVLLLAFAAIAQAQTYTVTNLDNTGAGSLRGELNAANGNPGADAIVFAPGLTGTITLSGSGLQVEDPVDLEGPGAGLVTVAQSSAQRVIHIDLGGPGSVTIAGLHIAGGTAPNSGTDPNYGGDILNENADLTVANAVVSGGTASFFDGTFYKGSGGGIASDNAPLTVRSTTVTGNRADYGGGVEAGGSAGFLIEGSTISGNSVDAYAGGIEAHGASGTIDGSTISGNTSIGQGAGASVWAMGSGTITVRNSTVSSNTSSSGVGGGLDLQTYGSGSLVLEASTVADNTALVAGGITVAKNSGASAARLENTIVAANSASLEYPDARGVVTTAFSLIGNPAGATITETVPGSDLLGVDPQLGPLQDNGGATATMALPPTSPAVNRGGTALSTDQRGATRPILFPGVAISAAPGANGADIGAYELQAPPVPTPPPHPAPATSRTRPRVRVSCPKSAKPGGCKLTLQVFSAKPHKRHHKGKRGRAKPPVAESAVARVELGPGRNALVTLSPKPKFAAKLETARKLLVREVETVKGATHTSYRRLKVVF